MIVDQKQIVEHKATILCPLCGLKFVPQSSNICPSCTISSIDGENVLRAGEEQLFCIYCNRYERPPWVNCQRESAELLAVLMRKVKGLGKSKIVSAKFVWTEPHSKRIKLKIEFIRVIDESTKVQQTDVVEFVEKYTQCNDCKKQFTPHDWTSLIQIRQHTEHKRTMLSLEQNLLRQKWIEKTLRAETVEGGMDLYFKTEHDAVGCMAYIKTHVPVTEKISRELVSVNEQNNTSNTKITHALIIPKINKDELLLLHPKFRKDLGNCSPLLLCLRVTSQLYFLDMTCNRKLVITPTQFLTMEPYSDIFTFKHYGRAYTILDNEGVRNEETHNTVATYGLVVTPEQQMKELYLRSHINCEIGYDYEGYCLEEWANIKNMPDFMLVKRIKNEEELAIKKDQKRKARREQRKREFEKAKESKAQSEASHLREEREEEGEEGEVEEGQQEWMDVDGDEDEEQA